MPRGHLLIGLAAAGVAIATLVPAGPTHARPVRTAAAAPARCSLAPPRAPRSTLPGARGQLMPTGALLVRLCRYAPLPHLTLAGSALLVGRGEIGLLARRFDALRPAAGVYSCPSDDGSQVWALGTYPRHGQLAIDVHLTGCGPASNGELTRGTLIGANVRAGHALLGELQRLTGDRAPVF